MTVWSIFIFTPSPSTSFSSFQADIYSYLCDKSHASTMNADYDRKMGRVRDERLPDERNQVDSEQRAAEAEHKNNAGTGLSGLVVS